MVFQWLSGSTLAVKVHWIGTWLVELLSTHSHVSWVVVQWQSGSAVAVKWHRIRTRVAVRLFIGSDVNWMAFQCLSSSAVAVKWHWIKTGLIGCNSYYLTANERPLNQSNINQCNLFFTVLPMGQQTPSQIFYYHWITCWPFQFQASFTLLSMWCQSNHTMPLRILYYQWMTTQPIQYKFSANYLSLCCQWDNRLLVRFFITTE